MKTNGINGNIIGSGDNFMEFLHVKEPLEVVLEENYEFVSSLFLIMQIIQNSNNSDLEIIIISENPTEHFLEQIKKINTQDNIKIMTLLKLADLMNLSAEKTAEDTTATTARKKILYVSDDKFMHFVLKDALNGHLVTIIEAFDGVDGLEKATTFHPDMILADMEMPGISGLELCKAVHSYPEMADLPVIIFSSNDDPQCIEEAYLAGAKSYIVKKFHHNDLAHKILKAF